MSFSKLVANFANCIVLSTMTDSDSDSRGKILRHTEREELPPVIGDSERIEEISGHIEKHIGPIATVFHELVSIGVHVDVHFVPATPERPWQTLVTSGMSDLSMTVPDSLDDAENYRYAELVLSLPPDWPLDFSPHAKSKSEAEIERTYWPVRLLKQLARLPHEYRTWLFGMHTVPNGDPAEPYADNTQFCCALLFIPMLAPEEFVKLTTSDGKVINFLSVIPLYREEMDFKLRKGMDPLLAKMEKANITELLQPGRPNLCAKRFWIF